MVAGRNMAGWEGVAAFRGWFLRGPCSKQALAHAVGEEGGKGREEMSCGWLAVCCVSHFFFLLCPSFPHCSREIPRDQRCLLLLRRELKMFSFFATKFISFLLFDGV